MDFASGLGEPIQHIEALKGFEIGGIARNYHQGLCCGDGRDLAIRKRRAQTPGIQPGALLAMPQSSLTILRQHGEAAGQQPLQIAVESLLLSPGRQTVDAVAQFVDHHAGCMQHMVFRFQQCHHIRHDQKRHGVV